MSDPPPALCPVGPLRLHFPSELPISARVPDVTAALSRSQVVIVSGATGSGKTTQLPKVALATGRGQRGQIGVTQPRRIAATSVASRVATELECQLGDAVGYQIRFENRSSANTRVKFMTDGILLAEIQGDPLLRRYDTLIIDEAHERSLTVDFLLGWLKHILPKRQDLRIIVSSATIETERFSEFFGGAPVVRVEGRTYPVDVLYDPPDPELDLPDAVAHAVKEVDSLDSRGDILVFLPGEREIREAEQAILALRLRHTVVLPLYARLTAAEQARVFAGVSERRVVLATNVAETSLTIPGIVYVVDTGVARLSRYDPATGTTRLQIEAISQASADQRKGRCGRVREGVCVRLFDERSFEARPSFTDPEIKRTGLAGVILRMKSLGLGDIDNFPFLDPPDGRAVTEGYRVLQELGALDDSRSLTPLGRHLARIPVDPRLGRMILAGSEFGCLREILVLAAALNIQDPRERPRDQESKADQRHQRFRDEHSDFTGLLRLWDFLRDARSQSSSQLRRACRENYLSFPRVREWMDLHRQLEDAVRELRLEDGHRRKAKGRAPNAAGPNSSAPREPSRQARSPDTAGRAAPAEGSRRPAAPARPPDDAVHMALLAGLLSRIGQWNPEARVYVGARQTRFALHPSSALAKKPPAWVMAFELVQTSRLFARTAARIDPLWLDKVGAHILKRSYSDPHWSEKSARASVKERATLFGLPVLNDRRVDYSTIAPGRARLMFLEHALVRGEYSTKGAFFSANRTLVEEMARLRDKARQSEMLVDDERMLAFFDARVPRDVVNGKAFETWRQKAEQASPRLLYLSASDVVSEQQALSPEDYPDSVVVKGAELRATYRFEPGADDDGVTLEVPLALLPQLDGGELDDTIPAWRAEKVTALLEALPRTWRREITSVPGLAASAAARLVEGWTASSSGPFLSALRKAVLDLSGVNVPDDAFRPDAIPPHLRFNVRVVDERGVTIAQSRDVASLVREYGPRARERVRRAAPPSEWERRGMTRWECGTLPPFVPRQVDGFVLRGYPALVDRQTAVDLLLLETEKTARAAHREGVRRLLALASQNAIHALAKRTPAPVSRRWGLPATSAERDAFRELLLGRVIEEAFALDTQAALPRSRAEFDALHDAGARRLGATFDVVTRVVAAISAEHDKTLRALEAAKREPGGATASADIRAHVALLVLPELIAETELAQLGHIPRYLRAAQARLARAILDPRKDASKAHPFAPVWAAFLQKQATAQNRRHVARLRWALEELRVSIFAPELKPMCSLPLQSAELAVAELK